MPETNFFSEEAARQILLRVANVFNDPDLCDAVFVVGGGEFGDTEEICAPSQFMATASPYFKNLFYPPGTDKRREITTMNSQIFRKILDYLFRGKVPLSSIEDAWKVKVAGRVFELKELEDLCTKFLKYRLDSTNLLIYLKNATKYECPDLKEVIFQRFAKDAMQVLDDDELLNLQETDLLGLIQQEPDVQARKVVEVLIKWAKRRYGLETPEKKPKLEENGDATMDTTEKLENGEKNDIQAEETQPVKEPQPEKDPQPEKEPEPEKEPQPEKEDVDLVRYIQPFIQYIKWDHSDAEYFLDRVRNRKIMLPEEENKAMAQMLQSFCESQAQAKLSPKEITPIKRSSSASTPAKRGRK